MGVPRGQGVEEEFVAAAVGAEDEGWVEEVVEV